MAGLPVQIPQPKRRAVLGDRARGERDMRSAASGDEMGPTHAERRGGEAAERGKAKYPSILGGRETRSRDKGGVASGRIGSYAEGLCTNDVCSGRGEGVSQFLTKGREVA